MKALPEQLNEYWQRLPDNVKQSVSPFLLLCAGANVTATSHDPFVVAGGIAIGGIGLHILGQIHAGPGYQKILNKLNMDDPRMVGGALGLAACASFGFPPAVEIMKTGVVDEKALLVFANFGPWLVNNALTYMDGVGSDIKEKIRRKPDIVVLNLSQNPAFKAYEAKLPQKRDSLDPAASAVLTGTGGAAIGAFGAMIHSPATALTGLLLVAGDAIRYGQSHESFEKTTVALKRAGDVFLKDVLGIPRTGAQR
jgi:hypothetical protein